MHWTAMIVLHPVFPVAAGVPAVVERQVVMAPISRDETTLLYADFPRLVQRWEDDFERTSLAVRRVHERFAEVVEAHGGQPVAAPLDARCAVLPSPHAAVAALAIRRAFTVAGEVAVRLALVAGGAVANPAADGLLLRRVRLLVELGASGQILLTGALATSVELADGRTTVSLGLWRLPGLNENERVFAIAEPDRRPMPDATSMTRLQ
jgi:hypothetical protein